MKTPDEIKKALRICSGKLLDYCDECNYGFFPEELSIQERYDAYNAWFNCHREV